MGISILWLFIEEDKSEKYLPYEIIFIASERCGQHLDGRLGPLWSRADWCYRQLWLGPPYPREGKSKGFEIKDLRVGPIRLGVGASYAHPLSEMFALGGFAEMRLSFTRLRYNIKAPGYKKGFDDAGAVGFGFAVGPYFRLGLWGADKKGGLAFAPYFALQSLRGAKTDKHDFSGSGSKTELKHESILSAGGGLHVDLFINKLVGINLGLELLGARPLRRMR